MAGTINSTTKEEQIEAGSKGRPDGVLTPSLALSSNIATRRQEMGANSLFRLTLALLVSSLSLSLTSCIAPPPQKHPDKPETKLEKAENVAKSLFAFANPGPFKLIRNGTEKNEAEFWQARGEVGKFGGVLHLTSFGQGPKTFNVWDASDVESHGIGLLQFECLVDTDPWTGKPIPKLAKEIKVSPDGKQVSFVLRQGLKWSDGKPLTVDDVVFTFNTIIKNNLGEGSAKDTIATPDDYPTVTKDSTDTVSFRFKKAFSPFLANLSGLCIAPKHILEPVAAKGNADFKNFWNVNTNLKTIVGSGPFLLEEYLPSQRLVFKRNPHYAMLDKERKQLPYLDKIVISIVPKQETEILQFLGGEVDLLDIRSVRGIDAKMLKDKEQENNFTLYNLGPDDGTVFLMFNMIKRSDPKTNKPYVDPVKSAWFNNTNFRKAISHAIDRKRIIANVLKGVGYPLSTCETSASLYYNKNLKEINSDQETSKKLLEEAGFKLKDGQLFDGNGNRVEFDLLTNSGNTVRDACCIMIKEELRKLGIKVNYQPLEFNALINKVHTSLDWQAMVMGLSGSRFEPYGGANVWKSEGRMHMFDTRLPDKNQQVKVTDARPWEKEIDQCFTTAAGTTDEAIKKQCYDRYQAIAYEEQPFIYLYATTLITAMSNRVGNYRPTPYGISYTPKGSLHNIEEIYIKGKP